MGNKTRTIGVATGNENTLEAAINWGQLNTNYDRATDDILILRFVDAEEFNESNLVIGGFTGTATSSKYVRIEVASGVRHDGTYNTSKARMRGNKNGEHVLVIDEDFVHIRHLAIQQDSTGSSDECIRINSDVNDALIEKCVLDLNQTTAQQDCIHVSDANVTNIGIFDCVFKLNAGNRAAINAQAFADTQRTQSYRIGNCTIDCDGAGEELGGGIDSGISGRAQNSSTVITFNVDNTACFDSSVGKDFNINVLSNGTVTWTGQGNMGSDTSCKTQLGATNNLDSQTLSVTDEAATEFLVTSLTASEDYQLIDGANSTDNAINNAIDEITRDSRIDITRDVAGNLRPTTFTKRDTGAFEVENTGGGDLLVFSAANRGIMRGVARGLG